MPGIRKAFGQAGFQRQPESRKACTGIAKVGHAKGGNLIRIPADTGASVKKYTGVGHRRKGPEPFGGGAYNLSILDEFRNDVAHRDAAGNGKTAFGQMGIGATATRAKAVGRQQELLIVIDHLALVAQIQDAVRGFTEQMPVAVISGGLRQVDHIAETVYHIKIVAWYHRINERLILLARFDPAETYRCALQPVTQLRPGHTQPAKRVRKRI
nr:hypothetical protein [uncultured Roseovarius sp.]